MVAMVLSCESGAGSIAVGDADQDARFRDKNASASVEQ
jgi:hypothetical protein